MNAAACLQSSAVLKPEPMPAEPVSHVALWLFLPLAATISGALMTPGAADAWAAVGALLGTFVAVVEASQKRRGWLQIASVVVASSFCGATIPGAAASAFLSEASAQNLGWQSWAIAGFVLAVVGWGLVLGAIKWGAKRAPQVAEAGIDTIAARLPHPPHTTPPNDRNRAS